MTSSQTMRRSKTRWIVILSGTVVLMFGFGYALVPLYDLFCEITGVGGKPTVAVLQLPSGENPIDYSKEVTVEFTATGNNSIPWTIKPLVKKTKVHLGEVHMMNYLVTNTSSRQMVGQAIPSVTPMQGARHMVKLECFCFNAQTLEPGEAREMPVRFYVNKDLPDEINTLTLSYSFFPMNESASTSDGQSEEQQSSS